MRIAVIGSGISGLAAAHALRGSAHVTLYEAGRHFGGHARTVDATLQGVTHGVDMGFLVFNHRTYPWLTRLFDELGVRTAPADMSFSVQVAGAAGGQVLEWGGSDLAAVFCQRSNLARPRFWRMLAEIRRFNALGRALAGQPMDPTLTLRALLDRHGFGPALRDWYLLPMLGCIWSCPVERMLDFPAATLLRFCDNHGLLQVLDRPQWYTVAGGSREYVRRMLRTVPDLRLATPVRSVRRDGGGVLVATDAGTEFFDGAVVATHAHQALALLADAGAREREVLGAIHCQPNRAVLHIDASLLPQRRAAWAAWNHEGSGGGPSSGVCLHYLINRLQPLPWTQPVIVSLNPLRQPAPASVLAEEWFEHPVFDAAAIRAQAQLPSVHAGSGPVRFCGAWTGYGFHEDGLRSGQEAARGLLQALAGRPQRQAA